VAWEAPESCACPRDSVLSVIEDVDEVKQTITNVGLMNDEELQDFYLDPLNPARLFLIAVTFHDR
jgi:hypothetical protein